MAADNQVIEFELPKSYDVRIKDQDFCEDYLKNKCQHQDNMYVGERSAIINRIEEILDVKLGPVYRHLLETYGKLSCYYFDTFGLYRGDQRRFPIVKYTKLFRKQSQEMSKLVVFALLNDGYAACCDENDMVYLYSRWKMTLTPLNMPIWAFIAGEAFLAERVVLQITANEQLRIGLELNQD